MAKLPMKAIFINVEEDVVEEITVDDSLEAYYAIIGCRLITSGYRFPDRDWLIVDDEGLIGMTDDTRFFRFEFPDHGCVLGSGNTQFYAGNGLILGSNRNGETIDVMLTANAIRPYVKFSNIAKTIKATIDDKVKAHNL